MFERSVNRLVKQLTPPSPVERTNEVLKPLEIHPEPEFPGELYELAERAASFGQKWSDNRLLPVLGEEYLLKDPKNFAIINKEGYILEELLPEYSVAQEDAYRVEYELDGQIFSRKDSYEHDRSYEIEWKITTVGVISRQLDHSEPIARQIYTTLQKSQYLNSIKQPADQAQKIEMLLNRIRNNYNGMTGWGAAKELGRLKDASAFEPLLVCITSRSPQVRENAVMALGLLGDRHAVPYLIKCLKDEAKGVRYQTVAALGMLKEVGVFEALVETLADDSDEQVRGSAAEALGLIGDPRAVEVLIRVLQNPATVSAVSYYVCRALGQLGDVRAVELLIQTLSERESHVGAQAAEALGRIGDRRAIEPLRIALQSDKWQLQEAAAKALKQLE